MTLVERIAAARDRGDLAGLIAAIPYASFLGLAGARVGGELIVTMRYGPDLIGNPALPALHGGTLGALMESAAIFELLLASESVVLPKTITITVDYLRPAATVDTHARGVIVRHGRRVANVRVEAWQDDRARPVASANAHFLVMADGDD